MNIFSEINCAYYHITEEILRRRSVTKAGILDIIGRSGFSETMLFLEPKLIGKDNIRLLTEHDGSYHSILKNEPEIPLSALEKRWLCASLNDRKSSLFLDGEQKEKLLDTLGAEPLFSGSFIRFFDRFSDGDDFEDEQYIKHFRDILRSYKEKRLVKIGFQTRKDNRVTHYYLPEKIEYSSKNDRFRVHAVRYNKSKPIERGIINLSQVTATELSDIKPAEKLADEAAKYELTVRVSSERNGINRFMLEFAELERVSEYDEDSRECIVTMKYDPKDETEILIRLLSFGPVAEVIAPAEFRKKLADRVRRQWEMNENRR